MNLLKNLVGVLGLLWLLSQWFPSKPPSVPVVAKPFWTEAECVALVQPHLDKQVAQKKRSHSPEYVAEYAARMEEKLRESCAAK